MNVRMIQKRLREFASKEKAKVLQGFFKTGPGEYGEGDVFLGIVVPDIRRVVKEFEDAPLPEVHKLLRSDCHEERVCAALLLVRQYGRGDDAVKKAVYDLYLKNTRFINNWDLVDLSAPNIVGTHLLKRSRKPLYGLVGSKDLWERRISILSTFAFIKEHDFADTFEISRRLLADNHDLIHKAVGWMLREVGKRDLPAEEAFLKKHYRTMPRTMLRYAIERFPEAKRRRYLNGAIR